MLRLEVAFGRFESAGVSPSSPAYWKVQNLGKLFALRLFEEQSSQTPDATICNKEFKKLNSDTCLIVNSIRSEISIFKHRALLFQLKHFKIFKKIKIGIQTYQPIRNSI